MPHLTVESLARLFGTAPERVSEHAGHIARRLNLRWTPIAGEERDRLIVEALRRINEPSLKAAGGHRAGDWESGWRENLDQFIESGFNPRALVPKYVKRDVPIRLERQYVRPELSDFVFEYTNIFRAWLYGEFFRPFERVFEFGCGTGHNLLHLAELQPGKALVGLDWAPASQALLSIIAEQLHVDVRGRRFDFFAPDAAVAFGTESAVFTFGALEQLGGDYAAYLRFLLERRPGICVDVVGIEELYDDVHLLDVLARLYHRRRNYLSGYLTGLRELEAEGRVEIVRVHHHQFGNLFDDPYSYVIWRPL